MDGKMSVNGRLQRREMQGHRRSRLIYLKDATQRIIRIEHYICHLYPVSRACDVVYVTRLLVKSSFQFFSPQTAIDLHDIHPTLPAARLSDHHG